MTATAPMKGLTAFVFFGLISGFVMCKSGVLDKTSTTDPSPTTTKDSVKVMPRHFGGSKSGIIVKPTDIKGADTSIDRDYMYSSKSGAIVEPLKMEMDSSLLDTNKKGNGNEFVVPKK